MTRSYFILKLHMTLKKTDANMTKAVIVFAKFVRNKDINLAKKSTKVMKKEICYLAYHIKIAKASLAAVVVGDDLRLLFWSLHHCCLAVPCADEDYIFPMFRDHSCGVLFKGEDRGGVSFTCTKLAGSSGLFLLIIPTKVTLFCRSSWASE